MSLTLVMNKAKGTVELLNFKTTNPEELQSIISQEFTPIEQVEPMETEFHADYKAYAVEQLIFTRDKFQTNWNKTFPMNSG